MTTNILAKLCIRGIYKPLLISLFVGGLSPIASADDTSSDAPVGFSEVITEAKGVMLRVPVNSSGEENTDAAEIRFYNGERDSLSEGSLANAWSRSKIVREDEVLLGKNGPTVNPADDSSTWGWYNWRWYGWRYPYYYSFYRPTFYYYNYWYSYSYYRYWNYGFYRYYYYWY